VQSICRSSRQGCDRRLTNTSTTARNSQQPPLLHLPVESRNAMWEIAYGDQLIHVRVPYHQYSLIHKVYEIKSANISMRRSGTDAHAPSLVCKQIWAVASTTFLRSAKFNFVDCETAMLLSNLHISHQESSSSSAQPYSQPIESQDSWTKAFAGLVASQLTDLKGLSLRLYCRSRDQSIWGTPDLMYDPIWIPYALRDIVRAFQ